MKERLFRMLRLPSEEEAYQMIGWRESNVSFDEIATRLMECVLLGTAQDAGVPQILCHCDNCTLVNQGALDVQFPTCLAIVDSLELRFWLIDATPDFKGQLMYMDRKFPGFQLAGIFITHLHMGHYTGLLQLGKEALNSSQLPVYASQRVTDFLTSTEPWRQLHSNENVSFQVLDAQKSLGSFTILPVPVPHRGELSDTVAFHIWRTDRLRGTFYCPDIDSWDDWDVRAYVSENAAVAVLDATFYSGSELPGRDMTLIPHPLVTRTVQLLRDVANRVVLTHLNHTNPLLRGWSPESKAVQEQGFAIASLGMRWTLE